VKQSKAYPYLRALLDGLIEAVPNCVKAPAKFASSLSEQLKGKGKEENKRIEEEIESISEDKLRELIKQAGCEQKEDIDLIVDKVKLVPELLRVIDYRFDKADEAHEEVKRLLQIQKPSLRFPLAPVLHNQTPPEVHFVGREGILDTIKGWYKSPDVRVGALISWGGVGKSALVRKWYDSLEINKIRPDGIFWWGFYPNAYLEQFLNALLRYVSGGQIEPDNIKSTWEKTERIKEYIHRGKYLIVLDGLEQMQKGQPGNEFGRMMHGEMTELLGYMADGPKAEGLCLITTRYTMKDLDDWENSGYENLELTDLSEPDALLMLRNRGVEGDDEQIKEVIERYKEHALSLTLLAGYLKKHYKGDIEQAPGEEFVLNDRKRFKDVDKLLRKYAEKMSEAERVFLNIFSLFRQDVTEDDFTGVFRKEIEDAKFNDVLVKMDKLDFRDLIEGLVDWRLIACDEAKKTYSIHPLIKGYFETDFEEEDKKLCHKRIYQYFGEAVPEEAETLEQMQPLFEQVYHGCGAGLYDEVWSNVYWEKIQRKQAFHVHQIGAWETDLSLVRTFFPKGDLSQIPLVSKKSDQGRLLNEAGLALKNTGRPKEAEEPIKTAIHLYIEDNEIANVSAGYINMAELQFLSGEIGSGLESAKKALEMSEKAKSGWYTLVSKAYFGWILHLTGENKKADKEFREADELQIKFDPDGDRLYGLRGINYADFLISMKRIDEALELTKQNLEICHGLKAANDISRCQRCLGAIERIKGKYKESQNHLQEALEGARKVGQPFLEIEALIEFGRLWLDMVKEKNAVRDANEALKLCWRTGFKFYEPGAEVVLGRAYLAEKDLERAESFAHSAYDKALEMKYRWAEGSAGHLLVEVYLAKADMAAARKQLKKTVNCRKEILDPNVEESEKMLGRSLNTFAELNMWQRILHFFYKPTKDENLLTEFEDTLMLVVDSEQLTNNLLSKLKELASVEKAFVYLADQSGPSRSFFPVDKVSENTSQLPVLAMNSKTAQWFRANRQILFFERDTEITSYLIAEVRPFLELSVNLAFPLFSMDRLIGIVFLHLSQGPLDKNQVANLQLLGKQAGLAFENALLFKERLRQNERMFRAEQLATMGQFAAGIAHELRNPLTAIRSTVQYLSSDFTDDTDQKKLANDILGEVDRLNNIVGNLLSLAQPAESNPEEIDVRQEIKRCLQFIEAKAKSQNVRLQTDFGNNLPKLTFDQSELRQLLLNVVMNSLQAMPDGGTLSIRAHRSTEGGHDYTSGINRILIQIEDEGAGIPSNIHEKIFEPFFTTKAGGTGLGLAICNSIVRRYNGEIWVEKAKSGGTEVKIALPVS